MFCLLGINYVTFYLFTFIILFILGNIKFRFMHFIMFIIINLIVFRLPFNNSIKIQFSILDRTIMIYIVTNCLRDRKLHYDNIPR